MIRNSGDVRRRAAMLALTALMACGAASANHFILPCGILCEEAAVVATGSMVEARAWHTATRLDDGRVLVTGGRDAQLGDLASAELYDPIHGTWTATGSMHWPRSLHTATRLLDGRVLVVGGRATSVAEIYDPATGTWLSTGSMSMARDVTDATLLSDGRVLVAGGWGVGVGSEDALRSAELYDPATGLWTATGSLSTARYGHTLTLLSDGSVLASRGSNSGDLEDTLSGAERYDPLAGSWRYAGNSMAASVLHTATSLPNGRVLLVGGNGGGIGGDVVHGVTSLFDPTSETWTRLPDLPGQRYDHAAVALPGGDVLVVGGTFQIGRYPSLRYGMHTSTAQFEPDSMTWTAGAALSMPRGRASMTLLRDGSVLIAGGYSVEVRADAMGIDTVIFSSAERYVPARIRAKSDVLKKTRPGH